VIRRGTAPFPGGYPFVNVIAKIFFAVLLIAEAMRSAALAQAQTADPKACANSAQGAPNQTLSDKLNQSNGVICPPNVDPGMKVPTPQAGKMPVIPPPGSPGGDPNIQPK
jgi:hypothetical protein